MKIQLKAWWQRASGLQVLRHGNKTLVVFYGADGQVIRAFKDPRVLQAPVMKLVPNLPSLRITRAQYGHLMLSLDIDSGGTNEQHVPKTPEGTCKD